MLDRDIDSLRKTKFDIVIIGGGINGAGIARDAAMRGYKVALLEKGDFASGTSSKSSKLIHGGLRYLKYANFKLVYEALHERKTLLEIAPHLVRPMPFIIPIYKDSPNSRFIIRVGLVLYDFLAAFRNIKRHKMLSPRETLRLEPALESDGLTGAAFYYDSQMDDARLCLENMISAHENGAVVVNYSKVLGFEKNNGRIYALNARARMKNEHKIRSTFHGITKNTRSSLPVIRSSA